MDIFGEGSLVFAIAEVVREGFLEEVTFELGNLSEIYRSSWAEKKPSEPGCAAPPQINHPK